MIYLACPYTHADPAVRRRIQALEDVHVFGSGDRVDVSLAAAGEKELRDMLDIAVAVADAAES